MREPLGGASLEEVRLLRCIFQGDIGFPGSSLCVSTLQHLPLPHADTFLQAQSNGANRCGHQVNHEALQLSTASHDADLLDASSQRRMSDCRSCLCSRVLSLSSAVREWREDEDLSIPFSWSPHMTSLSLSPDCFLQLHLLSSSTHVCTVSCPR